MGISDDDMVPFTDPLHWLEYFPPLGMRDLKRFGTPVDFRRSLRGPASHGRGLRCVMGGLGEGGCDGSHRRKSRVGCSSLVRDMHAKSRALSGGVGACAGRVSSSVGPLFLSWLVYVPAVSLFVAARATRLVPQGSPTRMASYPWESEHCFPQTLK